MVSASPPSGLLLDDEVVAAEAIADIDAGRFVDGDVAFDRIKAMLLKMK